MDLINLLKGLKMTDRCLLVFLIAVTSILTTGCKGPDFSLIKTKALSIVPNKSMLSEVGDSVSQTEVAQEAPSLERILDGALAKKNGGSDFSSVMSFALKDDPIVVSQRRSLKAKISAIGSSVAMKDYQVKSSIYAGIEDISDRTAGVALGINASRMIFDGGKLDAEITAKSFEAEAAKFNLKATIDDRAFKLASIWLELEKYETLKKQIDKRLSVLEPLIDNLEQVANAGIGDVSKVTAAQRTVSSIRVIQTSIYEGLAKAKVDFESAYGLVGENISYDSGFVEKLLPDKIDESLAEKSPLLLSRYSEYQGALANLAAIKATDEFDVGFEVRALRPLSGNGYDSDESVGFIANKKLFNDRMLQATITEAEEIVSAAEAGIEAAYREGASAVKIALQSIESSEKAIDLARKNAEITEDEIIYLRQQLIIGGSTLDSVLSAEAQLYDVEAKEIEFKTEKLKAQLLIASVLGLLGPAFDSDPD